MVPASFRQQLKKLPIKNKLDLVYLPAIIGFGICICVILWGLLNQGLSARTTQNLVAYSQILDDIAHNHAVERGLTAGFMASKGTKGADKLAAQRKVAEEKRAVFYEFYESGKRKSLPENVQQKLLELKQGLDSVNDLQRKVDQLSPQANPFQTYSSINKSALDSIAYMDNLIEDKEISQKMQRLIAVLWMKERAGQERGKLNGVFTRGTFTTPDVAKVNLFVSDQTSRMDSVERFSSDSEFKEFVSLLDDDASKQVMSLRDRFNEASAKGFAVEADAPTWFAQSTARIKNIKKYANQTAAQIDDNASAAGTFAWTLFFLTLLLSGGLAYGLWALNKVLASQMLGSIEDLISAVVSTRNNCKFSTRVKVSTEDELGQAGQAFNELMARLEEAVNSVLDVVGKVAKGEFQDRVTLTVDGDLKKLAEGVNASASKVEVTMAELGRVMEALEDGDFSARMSHEIEGALRSKVDSAMESMETAINSVNDIMASMNEGDFSVRIDAPLNGALNRLKKNVNNAVANLSNAIADISRTLVAQQQGDYSERVKGTYQGDLAVLKNGINESMDSVSTVVNEIDVVFQNVSQGDFTARLNADMQGDLAGMKTNINEALSSVDSAIKEVVSVCESQAHGDLDHRIKGAYEGQINSLKNVLNGSGDQLEEVFSQVDLAMGALNVGDFSVRINANLPGAFGLLARTFNESLDNLQAAMKEIREVSENQQSGMLSARLQGDYQGELKIIRDSINSSMKNLSSIIVDVQESAVLASSTSTEQLSSSTDMSGRIENQAASLEQVAATMEEMSASLSQTDKQCASIATEFQETERLTSVVKDTVKDTVLSVEELKQSSSKIANITGMIEEIAFQTNLLALNAAVEAARAGDQGRGFAVVASEVRNLALKSSDAAGEIKSLIEESEKNVTNSFGLVSKSESDLQIIADTIAKYQTKINAISDATNEQSQGVSEVNAAISALDHVTQANAAMVEEVTSSAQLLSDQSGKLEKQVKYFIV